MKFLWRKFIPLIIYLPYIILISAYSSVIPIWDSWEIADNSIINAISTPFYLFNFDFMGHPSFMYYLLISLPQYFNPGNASLLILGNAILGILSARAFLGILNYIFLKKSLLTEKYILTLIYLYIPVFTASTIYLNHDFGVAVFFIIFLYFLLEKKYFRVFIFGVFLSFSKETGFLLYLLTLGILSMFRIFPIKCDAKKIIAENSKILFILSLPVFLFCLRLTYKIFITHEPALWGGFFLSHTTSTHTFIPPQILARIGLAYLVEVFIINFNWFISVFVGLATVFTVIRFIRNRFAFSNSEHKKQGLFVVFYWACVSLLTYYRTFTNVRYFLPLYPLMLIVFYIGLHVLMKKGIYRMTVLSCSFLLVFISNFRTIDPLARQIFGTFGFGRHEMLKITSLTGECCGYGRDQLVYNLEFAQIHFLLNKFLADIKPTWDTVIAYQPTGAQLILQRLDDRTGLRTLKNRGYFFPQFMMEYAFHPELNFIVKKNFPSGTVSPRPETVYLLELPNNENEGNLNYFQTYYKVAEKKIYENRGYTLPVYKLVLK